MFFGDDSYHEELESLTEILVENITAAANDGADSVSAYNCRGFYAQNSPSMNLLLDKSRLVSLELASN